MVVVKRGCSGATVHRPGRDPVAVPAYRSARVFKIGSGDVFSAAFAHHWGERGLDAAAAADLASRAVHHFVDTRSLPLPAAADLADQALAPVGGEPGRVYLAAPFFHIAQRWLVEEARDRLHALGASVFSPLHDVGTGAAPSPSPPPTSRGSTAAKPCSPCSTGRTRARSSRLDMRGRAASQWSCWPNASTSIT